MMAVYIIDAVHKIPVSSRKLFYFLSAVCLPVTILGIHYLIVKDLPLYAIKEAFPYFGSNRQYSASVFSSAHTLLAMHSKNFTHSWQTLIFGSIVIISACNTFIFIMKRRLGNTEGRKISLVILTLIIFYATHAHEFFLSGVPYRLLWPMPLMMLLIFILLFTGTRYYSKLLKFLVLFLLSILLATQYCEKQKQLNLIKKPQHYLAHKRGQVYLGNSPAWINTVSQTTQFLEQHLKDDELFFALPYDPLYYYLTDRPSPTRQLVFFDFSHIPTEQEKKIIQELESKQVNYIVLSSRLSSTEAGLGTFGVTYCPILYNYILQNFDLVKEFGDWTNPPGWAWNHGTRVYQRKISR